MPEKCGCSNPDHVAAGYRCPACELSVATESEQSGIAFFVDPRLLDRPICEICQRELTDLIFYPPMALHHPPYSRLIKLASLRNCNPRTLAIDYLRDELAAMRAPRAFTRHYHSTTVGYAGETKPKRRAAKRQWKAWLRHLEAAFAELHPG